MSIIFPKSRLVVAVGCFALLLVCGSAIFAEATAVPYAFLSEYYSDLKKALHLLTKSWRQPTFSEIFLPWLPSCSLRATSVLRTLHHCTEYVQRALVHVLSMMMDAVPPEGQGMIRHFIDGVISVGVIGHGFTAENAAEGGGALPANENSTSLRQWLTTAPSNAFNNHPSEKFVFSLGAICAQLLLLKMFYYPPYRNEERNKFNRFFSSSLGWVLLIVHIAVPNPLMDMVVPLVMLGNLSSSVYTPAIVVGGIVRPYLVSLIRRSSSYKLVSDAMLHTPWLPHVNHWNRYTVACIELSIVAAACILRKLIASCRAATGTEDDSDTEGADALDYDK